MMRVSGRPSCIRGALPSDLDRIVYTHTAPLYVTPAVLASLRFSSRDNARGISFPMLIERKRWEMTLSTNVFPDKDFFHGSS